MGFGAPGSGIGGGTGSVPSATSTPVDWKLRDGGGFMGFGAPGSGIGGGTGSVPSARTLAELRDPLTRSTFAWKVAGWLAFSAWRWEPMLPQNAVRPNSKNKDTSRIWNFFISFPPRFSVGMVELRREAGRLYAFKLLAKVSAIRINTGFASDPKQKRGDGGGRIPSGNTAV